MDAFLPGNNPYHSPKIEGPDLSDGEIVKISSDLKNGGKVVFDEMSQKLFEWSKRLINETEKLNGKNI